MPPSAKAAGSALSDRSVRVRPSELAWRKTGDEVVVLDLAASVFHALNASGALMWERLADWTTAGELAGELVSRYRAPGARSGPGRGPFPSCVRRRGAARYPAGSLRPDGRLEGM